MSLTTTEIQLFTAALFDAFPTRDELTLLLIFVGKKIERYVSPSTAGLLTYAVVVDASSREGWAISLLQQARIMQSNNQKLQAFEKQYQSISFPVPEDPSRAPVLRADRPFIDRDNLRTEMLKLSTSGASRVLLVRGERHSGKSYSKFMVEHLAQHLGGFRPIMLDFIGDNIKKPDELAYTLISKIGGDVTKVTSESQGVTTAARWGLILATAVEGEVTRLGSHIWLVIDGLTREGVLPETIELVLELARRAEEEVPVLRVILLDLPVKLPPQIDAVALREEIGIIDEAKCVEWLETALSLRRVPPVKSDLEKEMSKVFATLPPAGDKGRLETLAKEVWKIVKRKTTPHPPADPAGGGQ